jgi:hypothetical protein
MVHLDREKLLSNPFYDVGIHCPTLDQFIQCVEWAQANGYCENVDPHNNEFGHKTVLDITHGEVTHKDTVSQMTIYEFEKLVIPENAIPNKRSSSSRHLSLMSETKKDYDTAMTIFKNNIEKTVKDQFPDAVEVKVNVSDDKSKFEVIMDYGSDIRFNAVKTVNSLEAWASVRFQRIEYMNPTNGWCYHKLNEFIIVLKDL